MQDLTLEEMFADLLALAERPLHPAYMLERTTCPKCGSHAAWLIPDGWECLTCNHQYRP